MMAPRKNLFRRISSSFKSMGNIDYTRRLFQVEAFAYVLALPE